MSPHTTWRLALLVPALAIGFAAQAQVQLNPKALVYQTPDQFKWRDPGNTGPNNGASLWARLSSMSPRNAGSRKRWCR